MAGKKERAGSSGHDTFTGEVKDGKAVFNVAGDSTKTFEMPRDALQGWYEKASDPGLKQEISDAEAAFRALEV